MPADMDANRADEKATPTTPTQPALVLINGIGTSTYELTTGTELQFQDVRVCLFNGTTPLTPYAIPDDHVMPFTNYVGVERGRGLDLGSFNTSGTITVNVFNASDLANDSAWAPSRAGNDCKSITCDSTFPCRAHAAFQAPLTNDVTLLGLVDDTNSGHVKLAPVGFEDNAFAGAEGDLWGTVVNLAGWQSGLTVGSFYMKGTASQALMDPLTPNTAAKPALISNLSSPSSYDGASVSFVAESGQQPFDQFAQTLDSIAFVSNPNVDPITFYDVRQNFVFALIGDPSDETSVLLDNGRNYKFDGTGLHIIAVPYATPRPSVDTDE